MLNKPQAEMAYILIFFFCFTLNEASSQGNLNTDKRILKCKPFLHKVYII